jgi:hypothetical protein
VCRLFLTQPETEDTDELLPDRAAAFGNNSTAPTFQIAFAGNPDEITADKRFPIHAIGVVDQELVLPGQSLGAMAP